MSQPTFGIRITGDNQTDKGAKAAERRLGQIPKHVGIAARRTAVEGERSIGRSTRGILRTFGQVEQAGARIFGGRSITSGITARLGAIGEAGAAAGTGLGEAAAGGSLLGSALGTVGVVASATVGILAAAAYGAFKLADGWAKGAASIGRTAEIIGVGTKAMQEFSAAAERVGVDKDKATGSLGGLSQTLNDARYGRNSQALAVLARLGVKMALNDDGTVDVGAMLPAIADAIAPLNSSGRRTAAKGLGISLDTLPAFSQGGKALAADMADADKHAVVLTDAKIAKGKRIARKGAMVGQLVDIAKNAVGEGAATLAEPGYDVALSGGTKIVDGGRDFAGTVRQSFKPAAEKIDRAVDRFVGAINYQGGGGGRLTREGAISEARKGVRLRDKLMAAGFNRVDATALAANAVRESGADYRKRQPGGGGRGLWQWDGSRKTLFRQKMGVSVENSSEDQQIAFLKWELANTERRKWALAHRYGSDAGSVAYGITRHVERPKEIERDGVERAAVARAMDGAVQHNVQIEFKNAPPGTSATVRSGRRASPAISKAFAPAYQSVHGG